MTEKNTKVNKIKDKRHIDTKSLATLSTINFAQLEKRFLAVFELKKQIVCIDMPSKTLKTPKTLVRD